MRKAAPRDSPRAALLRYGPVHRITLQSTGDMDDLARRWRALELHAAGSGQPGSFFLSWTFLGCLAAERFGRARLLAVTQDGVDVALALLGSAGRTRFLNETGVAAWDSVFMEHNGLLHVPEAGASLPAALRMAGGRGRLVLSGIDDATLAAARGAGWVHVRQSRLAPCVDLQGLQGAYLESLSGNARAQIRRSMRLYGPALRLSRAETAAQAHDLLDEMVAVHQAAWRARGRPGAFGERHMVAFHRALVARAWPSGGVDLLRITAGPRHVGTLYNFIQGGRVSSYQSGFVYAEDAREKPGLVSHTLAIEHYARAGARVYDLLAGAERYKLTLASGGQTLHWAELHAPWSAGRIFTGLAAMARRAMRT